ncbi:uncharacterized protein MEPE_06300 [Melanopsichium pennsylvanicum]|uniref:Uncharacterized protein n=1 Tax=Melanopsichium pennsylvanicum TaxID=63383 RepID=A0AAJ4XRL9_9BASI|nr:uncharacterized protein MEPE_06300 [Melanopsichium pennsylvanicum]
MPSSRGSPRTRLDGRGRPWLQGLHLQQTESQGSTAADDRWQAFEPGYLNTQKVGHSVQSCQILVERHFAVFTRKSLDVQGRSYNLMDDVIENQMKRNQRIELKGNPAHESYDGWQEGRLLVVVVVDLQEGWKQSSSMPSEVSYERFAREATEPAHRLRIRMLIVEDRAQLTEMFLSLWAVVASDLLEIWLRRSGDAQPLSIVEPLSPLRDPRRSKSVRKSESHFV